MCGIAGIYSHSNKYINLINNDVIKTNLEHRGPDNFGFYVSDDHTISLYHSRLSIIDTSDLGSQPMYSSNGDYVIVFNGEIYNYKSIRKKLIANGSKFKSKTDTEVLLELFIYHSSNVQSFVSELNGIFSIAIYDVTKKYLYIIKDHFGIKPLYYYCNKNLFAFASEIKSLLPIIKNLHFDNTINIEALTRYVSFLWCPGQETPFKNINKVNPGEYLKVQFGDIVEENMV